MYLMTGMIDPLGTGGDPVISNVVPSPHDRQAVRLDDVSGASDRGWD